MLICLLLYELTQTWISWSVAYHGYNAVYTRKIETGWMRWLCVSLSRLIYSHFKRYCYYNNNTEKSIVNT